MKTEAQQKWMAEVSQTPQNAVSALHLLLSETKTTTTPQQYSHPNICYCLATVFSLVQCHRPPPKAPPGLEKQPWIINQKRLFFNCSKKQKFHFIQKYTHLTCKITHSLTGQTSEANFLWLSMSWWDFPVPNEVQAPAWAVGRPLSHVDSLKLAHQ